MIGVTGGSGGAASRCAVLQADSQHRCGNGNAGSSGELATEPAGGHGAAFDMEATSG